MTVPSAGENHYDVVVVGGGLAAGLLTLACRKLAPWARVAIIERDHQLAGNHTWCFHDRDLGATEDAQASVREWLTTTSPHRVERHQVQFPDHARQIERGYNAMSADRYAVAVSAAAEDSGGHVFLGVAATRIGAREVALADHRRITGHVVLDARGPGNLSYRAAGFQKFVGLELETTSETWATHGQSALLMDARVAQIDGYRFMYTVPLGNRRLLVEDTYFSNHERLDEETVKDRVLRYCQQHGIGFSNVLRQESGVLPLPWRIDDKQTPIDTAGGAIRVGYGAGFFHPTTGYSFPAAVAIATSVAQALADKRDHADAAPAAVRALVVKQRRRLARQQRFLRFLNRMLFTAVPPEHRWHIFSRFYRLRLETIERFYAMELRAIDMARILAGRPPTGFSLRSALNAMEAT